MPAPAADRPFEIRAPAEVVLLVAAVFWTLLCNTAFFRAATRFETVAAPATYLVALGVAVTAVHFVVLALLSTRHTLKPLLAVLAVCSAVAVHFMGSYGVYLDPSMLRNVLHTHHAEAAELLDPALALRVAVYAGLPLLVLWRVRLTPRPWKRALAIRAAAIVLALVAAGVAVWTQFQPLASLMRNHREVRYLVTPANLVYSTLRVATTDAQRAAVPREPIGLDAQPGPGRAAQTRPLVVVLVVGETARAANWGLSGYARQTTPELATRQVVNFTDVTSCGTNTEVSVPCMFAPVGRRDYDEARIRRQESLLHVLQRAGVRVEWRDNQSGCKGVCDGVPDVVDVCEGDGCHDEVLLQGLADKLDSARGSQLWVMHMIGNHGPAYAHRYPPAFARFQPACPDGSLAECSREQIVNAYDNALLYTDHVLATLIDALRSRAERVDVAMLYVSDHGESLGENGIFLHGLPYAIAPVEQKRVPMVWWASDGARRLWSLDDACLRERAGRAASHDNLFHTMLGLFDVRTALYEPAWDLTSACRPPR